MILVLLESKKKCLSVHLEDCHAWHGLVMKNSQITQQPSARLCHHCLQLSFELSINCYIESLSLIGSYWEAGVCCWKNFSMFWPLYHAAFAHMRSKRNILLHSLFFHVPFKLCTELNIFPTLGKLDREFLREKPVVSKTPLTWTQDFALFFLFADRPLKEGRQMFLNCKLHICQSSHQFQKKTKLFVFKYGNYICKMLLVGHTLFWTLANILWASSMLIGWIRRMQWAFDYMYIFIEERASLIWQKLRG